MKLPTLPYIRSITPEWHEQRHVALISDFYKNYFRRHDFKVSQARLDAARSLLGITMPVRIVPVDPSPFMDVIGILLCSGEIPVSYKEGVHTILINRQTPPQWADAVLWHELIHARQADDFGGGHEFIRVAKEQAGYSNDPEKGYYKHPIELQAVGGEWLAEIFPLVS